MYICEITSIFFPGFLFDSLLKYKITNTAYTIEQICFFLQNKSSRGSYMYIPTDQSFWYAKNVLATGVSICHSHDGVFIFHN